jgi:citrate lyase subunit beta/citryl-CoA lyase
MTAGSTKILAMIETAEAFFEMPAIARAHPRVVALTLGAEDFALSVGMLPEAEGLFFPKQQMIIAARSAGILPLGFLGTVADFKDLAAFRATLQRSRRLGFLGAACIHPSQIPILNEEYAPQPDDVAHAERVVAAYEQATAQGVGAITVDGKMIDVPVVERAQVMLARHRAIAGRQARRRD